MFTRVLWALSCLSLTLLAGCPDEGVSDELDATATGDADTVQEAPERHYLLGGWAESVVLSAATLGEPERMSIETLTGKGPIELMVLPLDLFGVPWDAFDGPDNQPTELPAEWLESLSAAEALITSMRSSAPDEGSLQVVLSLSPITREGKALQPGTMNLSGKAPQWENCFDPSAEADPTRYGARYAGYVSYLVSRFSPDALILGRTMNRYELHCGRAQYDAMVGVVNAAHARLVAEEGAPMTIVEVDVEDLYGLPKQAGRCVGVEPEACFEERKGLLEGIVADAIGLHSMPALALEEMEAWPPDWLERVALAAPTEEALVTATSLVATPLYEQTPGGGPCIALFESDAVTQRAWLRTVMASAERLAMPWVAWHPLGDLVDATVSSSCPCAGDEEVCFYLDHVVEERAMAMRRLTGGGLWDVSGQARLGGEEWSEEVAR